MEERGKIEEISREGRKEGGNGRENETVQRRREKRRGDS